MNRVGTLCFWLAKVWEKFEQVVIVEQLHEVQSDKAQMWLHK